MVTFSNGNIDISLLLMMKAGDIRIINERRIKITSKEIIIQGNLYFRRIIKLVVDNEDPMVVNVNVRWMKVTFLSLMYILTSREPDKEYRAWEDKTEIICQ